MRDSGRIKNCRALKVGKLVKIDHFWKADARAGVFRTQSCRTTLSKELCTSRPPSMPPE
jgi:hypothetical protein